MSAFSVSYYLNHMKNRLIHLLIVFIISPTSDLLSQAPLNASNLIQQMVNAVSRDSLMGYIRSLESFGTRYEFTPQRDAAGAYILNRFNQWGVQGASDHYTLSTVGLFDLDVVGTDTVWMVNSLGEILRSTNGGTNWSVVVLPRQVALYGIDFITRDQGCVVGSGGTIFRTTNGGSTWQDVSATQAALLYDVSFVDQNIGIAVGSGGTILRTTNGGTAWTAISSGVVNTLREVRFISPSTLWIAGDSGTLLFSSNSGATWSVRLTGTTANLRTVYFLDAQRGWIGGSNGTLRRTTDGGASWSAANIAPSTKAIYRSILFASEQKGIVLDYYGKIFRTIDGGNSWGLVKDLRNLGWGPHLWTVGATGGQRFVVCGSRAVLLVSTDDGVTWNSQKPNLPQQYYIPSRNIIATIPGTVTSEKECVMVAHYDSYSNAPMTLAPGADDNATGTAAVMEAARIMRGFQFRSTVKLVAVSGEELGMFGSHHYVETALSEKRNIVGAVNGDMIGYPFKSDTARLVLGSYLQRNRLVDSALVYNTRYGIGLTLVTDVDSTGASDYGPFAIAGYDALDVAEATAPEIWGGSNPYYHKTTDTWDKLHAGMIRRGAQLMLAVVAEMAGPVSLINSLPLQAQVPDHFSLSQNYPNPFNPTTTITFGIPVSAHVSLKIYDLMGREVATLVDAPGPAGVHTVVWNASSMPSGVYYYRLSASEFVQTRAMVLVR